ncbi:hypothetical protein AVEN_84180-1 [Araneus ventricosus]|uniref:DUF4817 domain-containing protein n=1 Tax=Araneus ventricosus TaxID=182803 RepID=A0A4Y2N6N3_ARAVE|nr:hypothetical protein AVEN_84180-1 [Araneus ventricosus]
MSYFSAHHANVARKSASGKIVVPEPAELSCSCKRIPSQIRRGPMSPCVLHKMIQKFETAGQLCILLGRGRKQTRILASKTCLPWSLKPAVSRRMVVCQLFPVYWICRIPLYQKSYGGF